MFDYAIRSIRRCHWFLIKILYQVARVRILYFKSRFSSCEIADSIKRLVEVDNPNCQGRCFPQKKLEEDSLTFVEKDV